MSNLALIRPRRIVFRTSQNTDWLDGLPILGLASQGGVTAIPGNVGNGSLALASVSVGTRLGPHVAQVTSVIGGLARFTVTDPLGVVTAQGVVGSALYAGGLTFTLAPGATPYAVGDAFAVSVLPGPLDISGLRFDLDARASKGAATRTLTASSAPADGSAATIVAGTSDGTLAMRVLKATMARCPVGEYPFDLLATDLATGLTVTAFYGLIRHAAVASLQD
ncbi:hypothetical protein ACLBX9_16570 [Methylobacterium sp. A49B]